ncbi:MAG: flagellar basal body rod protein FlgC [Deltaproteobacteria bacterium]|nr:MAG: flagellar basal body rod protein FlgC [Deltaproteobacteria bacterium]
MADVFTTMDIAASGMRAQRVRMNTVASNLANANTTRTEQGGPYRRLDPVFKAVPLREGFAGELNSALASGAYSVEVVEVRQDGSPPRLVYDPEHPDADSRGYVAMPNVNVAEEMVNMITATRSYSAAARVLETVKQMARRAIDLIRGGRRHVCCQARDFSAGAVNRSSENR